VSATPHARWLEYLSVCALGAVGERTQLALRGSSFAGLCLGAA
jgi:hypothetical protein